MTGRSTLIALAILLATPFPAAAQQARLLRMATGSPAGVYFPVGLALCRLVNEKRPEHLIRCAAETGEGSVDNLSKLRAGEVDLAMIQSDVQADAVNATGDEAFPGLRSVMSLYPESVTVVAHPDAGISDLKGLEGKRVSAGPAGSGQREMWNRLMAAEGWTADDFSELRDLSSTQQASALCDGRIDAFVATIGHPALTVQEATLTCGAVLVPVQGPRVADLVSSTPALVEATIPAGLYSGNPEPIPTFGVAATIVTRKDVPEDLVYSFVHAALTNLDRLRGFDPALSGLDTEKMAHAGLTAPLQKGAARAYESAAKPAPGN